MNWILDADIRGFFDNISHEKLVELVELRVADRRVLRLIQKWLKAGVSEEGQWSETKVGTPQGAVISPLLERALSAELTEHVGYEKHDPAGNNSGNSRNAGTALVNG